MAGDGASAAAAASGPRGKGLTLEGVGLAYSGRGGVHALAEVSFEVEDGDFVAVVGPSGCGKSSLMKLVSGLLPPTEGRILNRGALVSGPTDNVGMGFQNPSLLPWRSAIENVLLPLEVVRRYKREMRKPSLRAKHRERALGLLETVGLRDAADLTPAQLSGGMRQRVSLCRALVHEPSVLLLDEPFGALDAFTREDLWGVLYRLWRERRFTCMLVTHDLREASLLASKIVVLSHRPARILSIETPPLEHPREADMLYRPEMIDFIKDLRAQIGRAMAEKREEASA